MQLSTITLILAIIARLGFGQAVDEVEDQYGNWEKVVECSEDCTEGDFSISWRECKEPLWWDQWWDPTLEANCKAEIPIKAEKCESCQKAVTATDLSHVCNNCGSQVTGSTGALGNSDCWAQIQSFDSSGNRLAFRHTANEIGIEEFFRFYRTGVRSRSMQNGCPGSQYRDPKLHFFWGDTTKIVMDVFDVNYNHATYVTFVIPAGSMKHPQWDKFFHWDFLIKSGDHYYNDFSTAPHLKLEFEGSGMFRNLYMASSHNGCSNDKIWFSLLGIKYACWDQFYTNPSTTTIVYSPFKTTAHTYKLSVGSKLELRLGGDFANDDQNGYRKILRYPTAAGVDFMDFYESGITDSSKDRYPLRAGEVKLHELYRSVDFAFDISKSAKLLVVLYDIQGHVAEALTFRGGASNIFDWFSHENLISSLKWDLKDEQFNFFSIAGDETVNRRMYINKLYHGCPEDAGYLTVACLPTDENRGGYCAWEDFSGGVKENRDQLCAIYYTFEEKAGTWNKRLFGSAIEIFVKY